MKNTNIMNRITIEYYRVRGKIKKLFEFLKLWNDWCKVFDDVLDKELNK